MNSGLMMLIDGRFPAGGHTNSAGVEAAVRIGDVVDDATLERYLLGRLETTGLVDAAFAAHTCALVDPTEEELAEIDDELTARIPSPALRDASRRFGRQLMRAGSGIWSSPTLEVLATSDRGTHQPVVLGALVAAAGGTPHDAASIALHHLGTAVTTAGVRLLGLDPLSVAALHARVGRWVDTSCAEADVWAAAPMAELPATGGSLTDILAEDHAGWDARLFVA
ncbi:MAG: urease accessory UreF family protein [Ilumatobacter sp.]|uniref:urease accessory protein UreF n=1 Tax=Ilumatobacter sp. TaxID=1967498 RepID=UPI00329A4509